MALILHLKNTIAQESTKNDNGANGSGKISIYSLQTLPGKNGRKRSEECGKQCEDSPHKYFLLLEVARKNTSGPLRTFID